MIVAVWKGKAVSVNRWHDVCRGRIIASPAYKQFIDDITLTIQMTAARGDRRGPYPRADLLVTCSLSPQFDHHNLIKPLCDAIEKARVVKNDRDIGVVTMWPPKRHKPGEQDEIWLFIREAG